MQFSVITDPLQEKSQDLGFALSEGLDQSGHNPSL